MRKSSKPPTRLLLSIDPAKKAGVALFLDGKLVGTRAADGSKWRPLYEAIKDLLASTISTPENTQKVVIEDGWLNKGWGAKGALTLGRRRGIAQAAAEAAGFTEDPEFIGPSTWQCALFGKLAADESKRKALEYVAIRYNLTDVSEDEADAVCIGSYVLTKAIDTVEC